MAESMVVGRGLVEILPDFRKWGKQLAADMKIAATQATNSVKPVEGAFRDSQGRLRNSQGAFIKEYENGWKGAAKTVTASLVRVGKGATLVGVGVAVASLKMAGDFQAHTAVLQTAAGETSKGLATVRKGILSIGADTGTSLTKLTDGMYTVEKAGYRGGKGLEVLRAAAQGAREENANLADVTNAMTSVMASYHLKASDSVRVMNAMKTAAGEGKITMEEFAGAMSTVLPIASANKIAFEQVAGAVATLTQHGTSAREATHELGATIRALASPNMVAQREMARFGLSSVDVSQKLGKRGLTGTFDLLTSTILSKMGPSGKILLSAFEGTKQSAEDAQIMLSKMPPEIKAMAQQYLDGSVSSVKFSKALKDVDYVNKPMLRNFMTLVDRSRGFSRELKSGGPAAKTYTDALKKMAGGAIGLNTILQLTGESAAGNKERVAKVGASFHNASKDVEGWKVTQNLLNVQLDRAKIRMQGISIEIGTKLIPVVTAIVGFFTKHKTITLGLVVAMLSLVGALSAAYLASKAWAVISGVSTAVMFAWNVATMTSVDSMAVLRTQMILLSVQEKLLALWTGITEAAFWGLAAAILANPITWIVAAVVALGVGIYLLATKTRFFQTIWNATWKFVKMVFWGFVNWFKKNWQLITFTIMTLGIGLAVAMIVRHWKKVKAAFSATINWIKHNWPLLLAILTGPFGLTVLYIVRHWSQIVQGAKDTWHAVAGFFVHMGKDIGSFFAKLPGEIGHFFSTLPGIVGHWFSVAGEAIVKFFTKIIPDAGKAVYGAQTALIGAGEDLIKGLFKGATDFFTKTIPSFFKTLWHGIVDYFKAVFGIHSPSTVTAALGINLIEGLILGMLRVAQTIGTWLNDHVTRPVLHFFANTGSWLLSHGKNLFFGFLRGALAVAVTIHEWISSHIHQPILSFFRSTSDWLISHGRNLINGLLVGARAIWAVMAAWLSGRPGAITSAIGNLARLLYGKGRDVLSGLWSGMKSVWSTLTGWVSGIAKWIKDHKGPLSLDAKLLTPAGKALMSGLLHGLKIGFKDVGTFTYGIGDSIASVIGKIKGLMSKGASLIGLGNPKAATAAMQFAQLYMRSKYGWGGPDWAALHNLWMGESGWNPGALNKSSGAYGIPQSLPASKMASAGADWRTNYETQIKWGLSYIKSVYGSPSNAYSRWLGRSPHWYDEGGIARRVGFMMKNTNRPERVLSPRQTEAFEHLVGALTHRPLGGGEGRVLKIERLVLENHGVIGSKHEVENWFVETMDQLKRRGRI